MRVAIYTGEINSGKTSAILNHFEKERKGDGWVSIKVFKNKKHIGYDLLRLSTKERTPFIREKKSITDDWNAILERRNWSFSEDGFNCSQKWGQEILSKKISPIYIDEVGKIELNGLLFRAILDRSIVANRDMILGVRGAFVEDIIKIFPSSYEIEIIKV